ncbi:HET-domain-containing protein [Byssothecium circinans]|uniref:HET-domain-containing protein n=1 Tax=Byssothecium circinans TaxID=147558 RepID=A0A6A5UHW9_9PLEO|nr:HET-domain-containing protein [Byssothecium circinans]
MRLLRLEDGGAISLVEYMTDSPPYAILYHTWGADNQEVTLKEMIDGTATDKIGYDKIRRCGEQAARDGLDYFWVDTCCIDKSSSAELSEAINSMFQYYQEAEVCYVYLADVEHEHWNHAAFSNSRWFTRGWTLQELLAPQTVKFFEKNWAFLGHRLDLAKPLMRGTRISLDVLTGRQKLQDESIATRMSWAAHRQTKRPEDMAYCLLGIFQVNLPLIYGEGMRAFWRLQEEIIRNNNDLTIFAWDLSENRTMDFVGLFAPSPIAFAGSSGIDPFLDDYAEYSVTNRGLRLSGDPPLLQSVGFEHDGTDYAERLYLLYLGANALSVGQSYLDRTGQGIFLRKISPGLFCRVGKRPLSGSCNWDYSRTHGYKEIHVVIDPMPAIAKAYSAFRKDAIHIPPDERFSIDMVIPERLWDSTDRIILLPKRQSWAKYSMVIAMRCSVKVDCTYEDLVVLCDCREESPELKVFKARLYPIEADFIFQWRHQELSLPWEELLSFAPRIAHIGVSVTVHADTLCFRLDRPRDSLGSNILSLLSQNANHAISGGVRTTGVQEAKCIDLTWCLRCATLTEHVIKVQA